MPRSLFPLLIHEARMILPRLASTALLYIPTGRFVSFHIARTKQYVPKDAALGEEALGSKAASI